MKRRTIFAVIAFSGLLTGSVTSCVSKNESKPEVINEAELTSANPLENLKMGNARFVAGKSTFLHEDMATVARLVEGQQPGAVVITCSDSRVSPEIIFDQGLGDIFTIRTAGNVMGDYEKGSIEYAVEHCHSKLVIVMGHTSCGAVGALIAHAHDDHVQGHVASIINHLKAGEEMQKAMAEGGEDVLFNTVKANVCHGVRQLRECEPVLKEMYEKKEIDIVGAIYHIETGEVEFIDI